MRRRAVVAALVLFVSALAGCGMPYTTEELAERSLASSFEAVNAFLRVEHANRDLVRREMPDVHRFAEDARREYPPAHRLTLAALELYRTEESAESKQELVARRTALERWAATARAYLASINERKPRVERLAGSDVAPAPAATSRPSSPVDVEPEGRTHVDGR